MKIKLTDLDRTLKYFLTTIISVLTIGVSIGLIYFRITSYNVCYTKLLRDVIYNVDDYPMNASVFADSWPGYMVDPDYAFTSEYAASLKTLIGTSSNNASVGTEDSAGATVTDDQTSDNSNPDALLQNNILRQKTVIYLVAGILILVFLGIYLLGFEIPYRRKYH